MSEEERKGNKKQEVRGEVTQQEERKGEETERR